MKLKAGIIVFLGTNCERDTKTALEAAGFKTEYVFHTACNLEGFNLIVLPGGFSFGDYIRAGRLAKLSPVMNAVKEYVKSGRGFTLGICNGFQILCEAGLLPGALIENTGLHYISDDVPLEFMGEKLILPIAHKEGRFWAEEKTLNKIREAGIAVLKYVKNSPNGSVDDIAGLYDKEHKVFGLMPHPERAVSEVLGNTDGVKIFDFIKNEIRKEIGAEGLKR